MTTLKRPHYFTPNEDKAIVQLFNCMSTEKLSIMLNISAERIVSSYRYLKKNVDRYPYLRNKEKVS